MNIDKYPCLWLVGFCVFEMALIFLFIKLWRWSQKSIPSDLENLRDQVTEQTNHILRFEQNSIQDEQEIERLRVKTTEQ